MLHSAASFITLWSQHFLTIPHFPHTFVDACFMWVFRCRHRVSLYTKQCMDFHVELQVPVFSYADRRRQRCSMHGTSVRRHNAILLSGAKWWVDYNSHFQCFVTDSFINFGLEYFTWLTMNVFVSSFIRSLLCEQEWGRTWKPVAVDTFRWSMRLDPTATADYSPDTWINVAAVIWKCSRSVGS